MFHRSRYSHISIALHWLMAVLIIAMIPLGWGMGDMKPDEIEGFGVVLSNMGLTRADAVSLHKSLGISLLILTVVRVVTRMLVVVPPLPSGMRRWERLAARGAHVGLYVLMLAIPMSGWAVISTSKYNTIPTQVFGLFTWPYIGPLAKLTGEIKHDVHEVFEFVHSKLVWVLIVLLVLHILAALKHHYIDKDDVLTRMLGRNR